MSRIIAVNVGSSSLKFAEFDAALREVRSGATDFACDQPVLTINASDEAAGAFRRFSENAAEGPRHRPVSCSAE
jgi:acetate kinase